MTERAERVNAAFTGPGRYLRRRAIIRLRAETVETLVSGERFDEILDIGCGDGSISLPLLTAAERPGRLTLLDSSSTMLDAAIHQIPAALKSHVTCVHGDIMKSHLPDSSYDLVLCLGVLAHVDDPGALVRRISALLAPRGTAIVQNTDAGHLTSRALLLFSRGRTALNQDRYAWNAISERRLLDMAEAENLRLRQSFRYGLPIPGLHRAVADGRLYQLNRLVHGTAMVNRNRWLGGEGIYRFSKV